MFEHQKLGNGLRVLTAPLPHAQSVACFVMVAAGSRYERAENRGIAHFAEHMFFKGTERRPNSRDLTTLIDGIGGEFNAFTSKEYTGYYVRCAGEKRDVALDVLLDMLRHSKFEPEEIDREKGVIIEEMNMYQDTPRDHIGTVYETLMYGDNPLGWEIIGTKDTVNAASRDTFTDYVDEWYTADRMVVGVAGMVGDDLTPMLEELLGDVPRDGDRGPAPAQLDAARRPARLGPLQGRRAGPSDPRLPEHPDRPSRSLRAPDALGGARLRDVLAPLPRGARAPRPRLLRPRREPLLHRRGLALRAGRASTSSASRRRSRSRSSSSS